MSEKGVWEKCIYNSERENQTFALWFLGWTHFFPHGYWFMSSINDYTAAGMGRRLTQIKSHTVGARTHWQNSDTVKKGNSVFTHTHTGGLNLANKDLQCAWPNCGVERAKATQFCKRATAEEQFNHSCRQREETGVDTNDVRGRQREIKTEGRVKRDKHQTERKS